MEVDNGNAQFNPATGKQKGIKDVCSKCKADVWWHQVQKQDSQHRGKWFYKCDQEKGGCGKFGGWQKSAPNPQSDQSFHPASAQPSLPRFTQEAPTPTATQPIAIPSPVSVGQFSNSAFTTYPKTTSQGEPTLVAVQPTSHFPQGAEAPRLVELVSGTVNSPATRNLSTQLDGLTKHFDAHCMEMYDYQRRMISYITKLNQGYATNTEILLKVCEALKVDPSSFGLELDLFHEWRSQKQKEQATAYVQDKMQEDIQLPLLQNQPSGSTSPSS
jgi:hypothetical protein